MTTTKEKKGFVIYKNAWDPLKKLTIDQLGRLFKAIFEYQNEGEEEVDPDIEIAFGFMLSAFKIDDEKYEKRCKQNQANSQKYHNNKEEYDRIRSIPLDPDKEKDNDKEKGKEKGKDFALNTGGDN